MRPVTLIVLVIFSHQVGVAQSKPTRGQTVKWLQEKLADGQPVSGKNGLLNYTRMRVNLNLLPESETEGDIHKAKCFTDRIVSRVSWKADEMDIQNDIFISGKLKESYTYEVPLTAIINASITNCQRNASGNVNGYVDRPVFVTVKKNTTKIGHQSFDKNGKAVCNKGLRYHKNSVEADWDSVIPIACNWDSNAELQDRIVDAFKRLAQLNDKAYTSR